MFVGIVFKNYKCNFILCAPENIYLKFEVNRIDNRHRFAPLAEG